LGVDPRHYFIHSRNMEMDQDTPMKTPDALQALAALSHATRLGVFRLLVARGALGLPAGEIARELGVAPSTLSPHLAQLERAGLATSWRDERRIVYAVNVPGMRGLLAFLTEDCCGGHPEICGYPSRGARHDDDLSQPGLRDVARCAGDDSRCGPGTADHRVPEDTADT
jgi:DNA-binding transcriptional ArsR family regulator